MFLIGEDIGHDLTRVRAVGKPVDDWNIRVFRHFCQNCFIKGPDHDQVDITAQHPGGVGDGFTMAQLHIRAREHHGLGPHLAGADVKTHAGPWDQDNIEYFSELPLKERLKVAAEQGAKIHPNYASYIEQGVSVAWNRMNYMMGCGTRIPMDEHEKYFPIVQKAEGNRHFLIGDQVSFHPGWQEGALSSVENALLQFNSLVNAA